MVTEEKQSTLDELVEQSFEPIKVKDGWCHSDMIFVEYGQGYGIAFNGSTVCLGDMAIVELYLRTGINKGLNSIAIQILDEIKELEERIGESAESIRPVRPNTKRSQLTQATKHKQGHTGRVTPGQRVSVYPVKQPGPGILAE